MPGQCASPPPEALTLPWSGRDERLAALAQRAVPDGAMEVIPGDADIDRIAGLRDGSTRTVPHADVTVEVRAASAQAADSGEFTIVICGTGRTAMASAIVSHPCLRANVIPQLPIALTPEGRTAK